MTSPFKALVSTPPIPYMAVLLKLGLVPIVQQPENKLGGGPVAPGVPQPRSQPQSVPDDTQP